MASRIDYSQNRKLYVGTTAEMSVPLGAAIIDNQLIVGGSTSSLMLDVASDAIIGSISTASSAINYENKLIVAGKNNYSDGTTWYGSYGQILLSATNNMTGSARQFLITNALDNNKFAIIRSTDWSTPPSTNSTATGVNSGTADFVINNAGLIGIGTTDPGSKLEVAVADNSSILELTRTGTASFSTLISDIGEGAAHLWFTANTDDTGFVFRPIDSDGNPNNAFFIAPSGNVGISVTNPDAKLEVNGNVIITTSGAVNNLLLTSTDTTTAGAPDIVLYADAPAVTGDTMGDILFQGQNGMVPTSTSPLTYTGLFSKMVDKDNNHSSLVITTHKGNGSGAQALTATLSAKGVNNSATGTLLINPSSVTDVADYNLEVKGDALIQDNFYVNGDVGIGTAIPKAKLDINNVFCVDSKEHIITNAFTTCLTVNLTNHTGCHVVITAFGDWGSHSSAAYRGEFFLQNGANIYNEPGIILRQDDNTSDGTDQIICQIVDNPSTANPKDFQIQIRHTDTTSPASFDAQLTYTVQGKFNSIT